MRSVMTLLPAVILALLAPLSLAGCDRQSGGDGQAGPAGETMDEVTVDEVPSDGSAASAETFSAKIDRQFVGAPIPDIRILAPDGREISLASLKGKPLVVNLWAVWCAPCVAEMPTLATLRAKFAAKGVQVIAVSQDTGGAKVVDAKIAERKLDPAMVRYLDGESALSFHYATGLLPTTVIYNAKGQETSRIVGAMNWAGPEGEKLVAEALK